LYRANAVRGAFAHVDVANGQLRNTQSQLESQTQAVAQLHAQLDAQTRTNATLQTHESIRSVCLEADLTTLQAERQQLASQIASLKQNFAILTEEKRHLQAFYETWRSWMFYRIVREMRRPFQQLSRKWRRWRAKRKPWPVVTPETINKAA